MKTLFTIFISLLIPFTLSSFPLMPKQFLLLEFCIIGVPSVFLALEPNNERIQGSFLETAIARSIPNALALTAPVFAMLILERSLPNLNYSSRNAITMALVTIVGFINLLALCTPYTKWRAVVVSSSALLITAATIVSIKFLGDVFNLTPLKDNLITFVILLTASIIFAMTMQIFRGKIENFIKNRLHKQFVRREELRREEEKKKEMTTV